LASIASPARSLRSVGFCSRLNASAGMPLD
jgi:hypothetical protein